MKKSVQILKFFSVLLLLVVALAGISAGAIDEVFTLTGIGGVLFANGIALADFETSDDAKVKRSQIYERLTQMNDLRKKEKRSFSKDEDKEYRQLVKDFDELTKHISDLEADEKRTLIMVGKQARNEFSKRNANHSGEWFDKNTGREVPVISKEKRCVDVLPNERNLSVGRAVSSMISGNWTGAEEERSSLSTGSAGGLLVPLSVFGNVIDLAREKAAVFDAGANIVPMEDGQMTLARVASDPEMETKAENEEFAGGTMSFEGVSLNAHTVGTIVRLSRELAADAPNVAEAVEKSLAGAIGAYLNRICLIGKGSMYNEPLGIRNNNESIGIPVIDRGINYGDILRAWKAVALNNGNARSVIVNPQERAYLASWFEPGAGFIQPPKFLENLQWLDTSAVPINLGEFEDESLAFVGDFSKLMVGMRQNIMIESTNVAGDTFSRHQVALKITMRLDIALEQPGHFAAIHGIKTPAGWYEPDFWTGSTSTT